MTNEDMIIGLQPVFRPMARQFLTATSQAGYHLRITSGYRSNAVEDAIYAQGRTTPGKIVSNARGGQSFHNFGLAIDVYDIIKGYDLNWTELEQIGNKIGLEHGDRGYKDLPHWQYRGGLSLAEIQSGKLPQGGHEVTEEEAKNLADTRAKEYSFLAAHGTEPRDEERGFVYGPEPPAELAEALFRDVINLSWRTATGENAPKDEVDAWIKRFRETKDPLTTLADDWHQRFVVSRQTVPVAVQKTVKVQRGVNIRRLPNTTLPPIGELPYGMVVTIIATWENQESINGNAVWYQIPQGYVWSGVF